MELAVPDTRKSTDDLSSDKPAQRDEGTLAADQQDQTTQSLASSDLNLISQSSSEIPRAMPPAGLTLFGGDVRPAAPRQNLTTPLPVFFTHDVDTIRTDSRVEKCLRQCKVDTLCTPSSGLLTKESLFEAAFHEPVHVILRDGYWWCIAGEGLLAEARRILTPPRLLPVLQRRELRRDTLLKIAVVDQVIQPARHQLEQEFLKARVPVLLNCINVLPDLFAPKLRDDQLATILRRSPRWFAGAKKSCQKAEPADED
jgi:hypothetical protein